MKTTFRCGTRTIRSPGVCPGYDLDDRLDASQIDGRRELRRFQRTVGKGDDRRFDAFGHELQGLQVALPMLPLGFVCRVLDPFLDARLPVGSCDLLSGTVHLDHQRRRFLVRPDGDPLAAVIRVPEGVVEVVVRIQRGPYGDFTHLAQRGELERSPGRGSETLDEQGGLGPHDEPPVGYRLETLRKIGDRGVDAVADFADRGEPLVRQRLRAHAPRRRDLFGHRGQGEKARRPQRRPEA